MIDFRQPQIIHNLSVYQLKTKDPATAVRAETGQKYQGGPVCINSQLETNFYSGIPNNVGKALAL